MRAREKLGEAQIVRKGQELLKKPGRAKRTREYYRYPGRVRESKSIEEVQGVLQWASEGKEGRDSVREGQ